MLKFFEYISKKEREEKEKPLDYIDIGHDRDLAYIYWYVPETQELHIEGPMQGDDIYHGKFHVAWNKVISGRYDTEKQMVSIAPGYSLLSNPHIHYIIHDELMPKLKEKFNFKKYKIFNIE